MLITLATPFLAEAADVQSLAGVWELRLDGGGEIYSARLEIEAAPSTQTITNSTGYVGTLTSSGRTKPVDSIKYIDGFWYIEARIRRRGLPVLTTLAFELKENEITGDIDFDAGVNVSSMPLSGKRVPGTGGDADEKSTPQLPTTPEVAAQPGESPRVRVVDRTRKLTFQNERDGYQDAIDTEIWKIAPDKILDRQGTATSDGNNGGGESQVLMRFDHIIGTTTEQIPAGSHIRKATLVLVAFDPGTTVYLHRLLVPWNAAATWDGMGAGIAVDNLEASTVRDGFSFGEIVMDKQQVEFDVTQTVQRWTMGDANHGWVFVNTGSNGWDFYTSDWIDPELRPKLIVEFDADSAPQTR